MAVTSKEISEKLDALDYAARRAELVLLMEWLGNRPEKSFTVRDLLEYLRKRIGDLP